VGIFDNILGLSGGLSGALFGNNRGAFLGFGNDGVSFFAGFLEDAEPGRLGIRQFLLDSLGVGHGLFNGPPALFENFADWFIGKLLQDSRDDEKGDGLRNKMLVAKTGFSSDFLEILDWT